MIETIFEDDEVSVHFCGIDSDVAVLSYSPMQHDFSAKGIPALAALRSANLDVFGIIAKRDNWYPQANMIAAASSIRERLLGYRLRIGYGSSMGAYGALKNSGLTRCDYVLALAPQYSINPAVIGKWDTRFTRHFLPELNADMEIQPEEYPAVAIMVVDPTLRPDLHHVASIAEGAPASSRIEIVKAWHCGHTVINPIASRATLNAIFNAIQRGDVAGVQDLYRSARKSSAYFRAALLDGLAKQRLTQGRLDEALRAADASVQYFDKVAAFRMTKSRVHKKRSEYAKAAIEARRAIEIEPHNAFLKRTVDELLAELGPLL